MIDSRNSNVREIVSQLAIASALFSAGETRAQKLKQGRDQEFFPWWGITGNSRDSVNDECRGQEKLGGPGACSLGKF